MCGIIGIASNKPVSMNIINSLKRLEYRGYDSAGLATLINSEINEKKCSGRVEQLEKILFKTPAEGNLGIGHVRWATHGIPNEINAHPHSSEIVSVVHNGIIENSSVLKKDLENRGQKFKSQTDTEVITLLLTEALKDKEPLECRGCRNQIFCKRCLENWLTQNPAQCPYCNEHNSKFVEISPALFGMIK